MVARAIGRAAWFDGVGGVGICKLHVKYLPSHWIGPGRLELPSECALNASPVQYVCVCVHLVLDSRVKVLRYRVSNQIVSRNRKIRIKWNSNELNKERMKKYISFSMPGIGNKVIWMPNHFGRNFINGTHTVYSRSVAQPNKSNENNNRIDFDISKKKKKIDILRTYDVRRYVTRWLCRLCAPSFRMRAHFVFEPFSVSCCLCRDFFFLLFRLYFFRRFSLQAMRQAVAATAITATATTSITAATLETYYVK